MKYQRILLKLSGEALLGSQEYGIDPVVLKQYAQEVKSVVDAGVQAAQNYSLIISLPGHKTNTDQLELVGKTVTFIEGDAVGSSATIAAYAPEDADGPD